MKLPAHLVRPARPRQKAAAPAPSVDYQPGHFTALIRRHDWPPMFVSQIDKIEVRNANGETAREVATRTREQCLAEGKWHATGTVPMAGTPKDAHPLAWLKAVKAAR